MTLKTAVQRTVSMMRKDGSRTSSFDDENYFVHDDILEEIKRILKIEPRERSKPEIMALAEFFYHNSFFQKQAEILEEQTFLSIFKNLALHEVGKGENVFNYGDEGNLFYIIIEGKVTIHIPAPEELTQDKCSPEGLITFLIENYENINWLSL